MSRFLVVFIIFSWKRYKNLCEKLYLFNTKGSKNTVINSKSSCQGLYLLLVSLPVQCTGIAMNCDCHESLQSKYCWTSGHCQCHGFILLKCLQCTIYVQTLAFYCQRSPKPRNTLSRALQSTERKTV